MLAVVFFGSKEPDRNETQGQEEAGWQAALFNTWARKKGLLTKSKYCGEALLSLLLLALLLLLQDRNYEKL
jgi:hypothetical protein